jgi:hypothetical protein
MEENIGKDGYLAAYTSGGSMDGVIEYGIVELDKIPIEKRQELLKRYESIKARNFSGNELFGGDFGSYVNLSGEEINVSNTFMRIPVEIIDFMIELKSLGTGKLGSMSFEREISLENAAQNKPMQR